MKTKGLGYFTFVDLEAGETYVITVSSKSHRFANPSRVVTLHEDMVLPIIASDP